MKHLKIVVVGDGAIGKTCLLIRYTTNAFPGEYIPTVFDNYSANVMYKEQAINLQLWDTAGQEEYKKLRPLSYPQTDIFIIGFSLVDEVTLENVENVWINEIKEHCPDTPYILLGLKSDLRDNPQSGMVSIPTSKGEAVAKKIKASAYVECSAYKAINMKEAFEVAIDVILFPKKFDAGSNMKKSKKGKCELI
jgi:small GTP-binding protein